MIDFENEMEIETLHQEHQQLHARNARLMEVEKEHEALVEYLQYSWPLAWFGFCESQKETK